MSMPVTLVMVNAVVKGYPDNLVIAKLKNNLGALWDLLCQLPLLGLKMLIKNYVN